MIYIQQRLGNKVRRCCDEMNARACQIHVQAKKVHTQLNHKRPLGNCKNVYTSMLYYTDTNVEHYSTTCIF